MPPFDLFKDVYDVKLKPRMLKGLIEEHFPEENQPCRIRRDLSKIVYFIRTHNLLSESVDDSTEKKFFDSWKSAVEEWVVGVLRLVSSNTPDKCWTGVCLLGVTCQECNSDRFLASYTVWFNKLYSHIQQPSESQFVKVASCNAISDLFTRLDKLPNAKKDGSSLAGKLIQPLLKMVNEDSSEAVWEGAIHLFCTILNYFPASVRHCVNNAEATIASKLLSGKCSENMTKNLVYCLALLPKAKGVEESWWLMMQKILLLINRNLSDRFQGLEEENKGTKAIRALVPPGKDPPPPLGGHMLLREAMDKTAKRSERLTTCTISMLIFCCSMMLKSSYPARVNVPIHPLLALVERVLMVDGSVPRSLSPFMTSMLQQSVCVELPVLHSYSLELLAAIVEDMHNQLLPHGGFIFRFVKQYFKRCALPELRRKLYSITKPLLLFLGVGMALSLAEEIVDNACVDLNPVSNGNGCTTSGPMWKASFFIPVQCRKRKWKHGATTDSSEGQHEVSGSGMEAPKYYRASPTSLKMAALQALETLLTVAGDLGSLSWRPTVNQLLITLATDYCNERWGNEENSNSSPDDPTVSLADLQLSVLRALLASLLSSARMRPPYFGRALELFVKGKQQGGRELAGFCAGALLALEVLIHPRFLPLESLPYANSNSFTHRFSENVHSVNQKRNTTYFSGMHETGQGDYDSFDDNLYDTWFGDGNPSEIPVHSPVENIDTTKLTETLTIQQREKISDASGQASERNNKEQADVGTKNNEDEVMVDLQQVQDSIIEFQEISSSKGVVGFTLAGDLNLLKTKTEAAALDGGLDDKNHEIASGGNVAVEKSAGTGNGSGHTLTTSYVDKGKTTVFDLDNDSSSMDSFPDIVDVDPDSDE